MAKIKNKKDIDNATKTWDHKKDVFKVGSKVLSNLYTRFMCHDDSKMEDPEFDVFSEVTSKLSKMEYGSEEYNQCLEDIKPALDAHYSKNDHHPQFFSNGIKDMHLLQLIEMLVDWYCSTKRQDAGNIRQSIEKNRERFGYSKELEQIFINTIPVLENLDENK